MSKLYLESDQNITVLVILRNISKFNIYLHVYIIIHKLLSSHFIGNFLIFFNYCNA